jgi:sugar O-acyltransferase (sialic acid O-acetyltransferase NeuD family)
MTKLGLILIGAGGHARSCVDVIERQAVYQIAGLVGLSEQKQTQHFGYSVIACDEDLSELVKTYAYALIAVGQLQTAEHRIRLYLKATQHGFQLPAIIAPTAYVSRSAHIGAGTIVMNGAVVNAGAKVGNNCIINTRALIEHDAVVEDHCHISTGAILNGDATVGVGSFIGSGSVIKEGVSIGERCVVGMGLAVRHNQADNIRFVGSNTL